MPAQLFEFSNCTLKTDTRFTFNINSFPQKEYPIIFNAYVDSLLPSRILNSSEYPILLKIEYGNQTYDHNLYFNSETAFMFPKVNDTSQITFSFYSISTGKEIEMKNFKILFTCNTPFA